MSTTRKQNSDFIENVMSSSFLEDCISWIATHLSPEDVFSKKDLEAWAEENDYVKKE